MRIIKHNEQTPVQEKKKAAKSLFKPRSKEPNFILSVVLTVIKMFVILVIILGVSGIGGVLGIARAYVETTPTLDVEKIEDQDQTSFIYDGNGDLITEYAGVENRVWASLDEIPKTLQDAFVAIEDVRFYSHKGLDIKRLVGALANNLMNQDIQGGSTITQQLIKKSILSDERTYKRKIQEAYLSMQLESRYSKEQILEAYLNTIPLGGPNYGVKTAAKDFFGKELNELTLRECATLAGLTQNPNRYNPRLNYYNKGNSKRSPETTDKRANTVLYEMYENGFITKAQYEEALQEKLVVVEESKHQQMYEMPYFIEYAIYDIINHLIAQRKLPDNAQNRAAIKKEIMTKGYRIYLTVDPEIQKTVASSLQNWKSYPRLRNSKDSVKEVKNPDGTVTKIPQPQSTAVVFDYHTGELKAIVGGRYDPTSKEQLNRAYQALMPVGSSIKPLAVYGPALDKGASPATLVDNSPVKIPGWNTKKGYPDNYGGGGFSGPTTLRTGLIKSLNVVAARALMEIVGLEDSFNYLVSLGINPKHINKDGPGLALGTSGITPIEMAAAFGAIGNDGVFQEPLSFTKVEDSSGNVILDAKAIQAKRQVFKPSTAFLLVDMMQDAVNRGTGSNARFGKMPVAGKTGTNSDQKGVFFAGLTPYYSAAVWVGHDGYKPLYSGAQGGRDAAPLWRNFMNKIHSGLKSKPIIDASPASLGLVKASICSESGLRATAQCPTVITEWFAKGSIPSEYCSMEHQPLVPEEGTEPDPNTPGQPGNSDKPKDPDKPEKPPKGSEKPDKHDKPDKPDKHDNDVPPAQGGN